MGVWEEERMRNLCLVLTTYMLCKQAEWSAARAAEEEMKHTDSEVVQVVVHGITVVHSFI